MISNKLQSGSRTRTEFLRAVVTSAKDFLTHNKTKFNEMLERTAEEERNERTRGKGPFNFDTKGNAIADNLANEAQQVVHRLFYEILASISFPDEILPSPTKPSHELVREPKGNHDAIRFVLVFDEATTLIDQHLYNSFRWILDNVIQKAWERGKWRGKRSKYTDTQPLPFIAIFLGTNSKVADFTPPGYDCSYRYFVRETEVPRPFRVGWHLMAGGT